MADQQEVNELVELLRHKMTETGALPMTIDHPVKVRLVPRFVFVHPVTGEEHEVTPESPQQPPTDHS